MKHLLYTLLVFMTPLLGGNTAVVPLSTSNSLRPIYISQINDTTYINELEQIFRKDLSKNGFTKATQCTDKKESILAQKEKRNAFNAFYWKDEGMDYVIKLDCVRNALHAQVFDVHTPHIKEFFSQPITNNRRADRQTMHKLADAVTQALFRAPGIAAAPILFTQQTKYVEKGVTKWRSEIWEVDYDGGNAHRVLQDISYTVTPIAIPQSPQFFFVSYKYGQPKIYIGDKTNGNAFPLIPLRGNQLLPTISQNRRKIAFICDASGRADLFVQAFDPSKGCLGKPIQAYSFPSSVQASPTLSPDGRRIAFVSDRQGTPRVYLIDTPAYSKQNKLPTPILLSRECRENTSPHWSPDGKKIAYSARIAGVRQIVIYDLETDQEWQLTTGPMHKENPKWAPNSVHLVYNTLDGEAGDLYVININEKKPEKITRGAGKKHYPSWEAP